MSEVVTIVLLGVPVGKGRPRFVRSTGHVYTPPETRKYEDRLRGEAVLSMAGRRPLDGPLEVGVVVVMPIPESWSRSKRLLAHRSLLRPTVKPDADNFLKVLDACNGVVWGDDSQLTDVSIRKRYGAQPALHVFVRQITAADLVEELSAAA